MRREFFKKIVFRLDVFWRRFSEYLWNASPHSRRRLADKTKQ